uniref:Uncharacterized protein n=1 Tax=viral metagenome TaxID=1070528 RepID=A0A6C0HV69_9ZZZZ
MTDTSSSVPIDTSSSAPIDTSSSTPNDTSSSAPIETSSSAPIETSSSTPNDTSSTNIILESDKTDAKNIMIATISLNILGFILICISIYIFINKRNLDNIMIFIMIFYAFLIPANLIMTGLYLDEANYSYEEILKKINDKPEAYSISKWKAKIEHKKHYLYNIYTSIALSAVFVILIIIFSKYSSANLAAYDLEVSNRAATLFKGAQHVKGSAFDITSNLIRNNSENNRDSDA